eukprot:CAMPEP_0179258026 /NCGR_PEP_ID=MMETSP0797-20121207/25101_1 /TAXON_ID=47934 /ORGANISM="Dinophysis acuminata, Strain DAEP01" /LENGTH=334 /DNA_ID=CAMNT_0020966041 /DNA_START=68 /DNA_END=1069 /DNA_ORIENTATION=-
MASAAEQEERIATIVEVAGASPEQARNLLLATDWSVENAIGLHFASADGAAPAPRHDAGPVAAASADGAAGEGEAGEDDDPEEPQPPPQPGLLGSIGRAAGSTWQSFMGIASEDFDDWFLQRFGTPKPTFCQTHFGDTIRQALEEKRLVLLFFYGKEDVATQTLCREVLQNPLILRTLRQSYSVWGADVCRFEPAQLARLLGVNIFPGLCVLQPLPNGFDHAVCLEWPLGTFALPIFRLGPLHYDELLNTEECITALTGAASDHQASIAQRRAQQERQTRRIAEERLLKASQDREYEEALLADQLRTVESLERPAGRGEAVHGEPAREEAADAR